MPHNKGVRKCTTVLRPLTIRAFFRQAPQLFSTSSSTRINCDGFGMTPLRNNMYGWMEKSHKQARAFIALSILLACCTCAFALDPSLDVSQYAHASWKTREGFAKGGIASIAQTADGYLWLGTEFGLFRFDGVRAVPWQPPGNQHLPPGTILSLLVGR